MKNFPFQEAAYHFIKRKWGLITYVYKKLGNKLNYVAMHEFTKVIYKFISTFGKVMDLARYQAKSRDKLINHSCPLSYTVCCKKGNVDVAIMSLNVD